MMIVGVELYYIVCNYAVDNGFYSSKAQKKMEKWKKKGCFSYSKLTTYAFCLYEVYHHWNDVYYIFYVQHWNWAVVLILFLSFWIGITYPFMVFLGSLGRDESAFHYLFVHEGGS